MLQTVNLPEEDIGAGHLQSVAFLQVEGLAGEIDSGVLRNLKAPPAVMSAGILAGIVLRLDHGVLGVLQLVRGAAGQGRHIPGPGSHRHPGFDQGRHVDIFDDPGTGKSHCGIKAIYILGKDYGNQSVG